MSHATRWRHIRRNLGVVCGCWLLAAGAGAQPATVLRELGELHGRIADPDTLLTVEDAKQAGDRLAEWKLEPERLTPEDRARLRRIEVCIALAEADARTALQRAQVLLDEFPDDAGALETAYLAACAAGDARLGTELLKKLAKTATADQRRLISQRRRWMRGVGKQAPEVELRTEDSTSIRTRRRGERVLLIDFWNVGQTREDDTSPALRDLHKEYRHSRHLDVVGVNADAEARVPEAKAFAEESGYLWNQCYERADGDAQITHKAFHAGRPPWQVLIDTFGYVRAVGSVGEPGFRYALRAAVAEAGGDYELVLPRARDGSQPERPSARIEPRSKKKSDTGDRELPSNQEARAKLTQARAFLRAKSRSKAIELFQEIVREYPGTKEAQEAKEYLDSLIP